MYVVKVLRRPQYRTGLYKRSYRLKKQKNINILQHINVELGKNKDPLTYWSEFEESLF